MSYQMTTALFHFGVCRSSNITYPKPCLSSFPFFLFPNLLLFLYVLSLVAQSCPTLCDPMDCSPSGSSVHGDSPGKNTGVGCRALLQGIFPTQGLNPCLTHCCWILRLGRSPGGRHGNLLQYSCLENLHGQRSLAGYIQPMGS